MKTVNETYITNTYCFVWKLFLNGFQQGIHSSLPLIPKMASPKGSSGTKKSYYEKIEYSENKYTFQPTKYRRLRYYMLWLNILSSTRYNEIARKVKKQLIYS